MHIRAKVYPRTGNREFSIFERMDLINELK